jgi:CheY-like chemotaxis protein
MRAPPPSRRWRSDQRPLTILVVDDAEDTAEMYARYFRFAGARAITARDGVEAVQLGGFYRPDAIIMDLAMPRMTGWEAIAVLKSEPKTRVIPIISVTGHVFARSKEDALSAGVDLYLTKPCTPDVLYGMILNLLRTAGQRSPGRRSS